MGDVVGGLVNAVKGVVDAVAPIASMIPGVGLFAMGAKAAVDVAGGIFDAMDEKRKQDDEDSATNGAAGQTAQAFAGDPLGGIGQAIGGAAQGILSGGIGGLIGGL